MAILIPENLPSRRDVPPAVARIASALRDGLDDAATVWYEPLFDVKGKHPDFVVLAPDSGILVLEVLQEKAGALAPRAEQDQPLARADTFARSLQEAIERQGRLRPEDRLPVTAAAALPYSGSSDPGIAVLGRLSTEQVLFRDDLQLALDDPDGFGRRIRKLMPRQLRDPLSAEAEKIHRALIHPDTVIGPAQLELGTSDLSSSQELKVLDRHQEQLAKNLGQGHRVIRGVAGSGKTLVLTYRAKLLAEAFPQHRVLVTCYTRSLAGALGRQLTDLANVDVRTLNSLMNKASASAGLEKLDFKKVSAEDIAEQALQGLDKKPKSVPRYDHVLIDEAQDFPTPALKFAVALLKPGSESLLVVADAAQNIFRSKFTWKEAGINAVGRTRKLTRSYRNTRPILEYAHAFLMADKELRLEDPQSQDDETVVIPPEFSDRPGSPPTFLLVASPQAEVVAIVDRCAELLEARTKPVELAVLYGATGIGGFNWPDNLLKAFAHRGIKVFWANQDDKSKGNIGVDREAVVLSTIHSAKGLEFKHVFLCGYLDDKPPENSILSRRLIYVGMTRATHELVLTASGKHAYIADLDR